MNGLVLFVLLTIFIYYLITTWRRRKAAQPTRDETEELQGTPPLADVSATVETYGTITPAFSRAEMQTIEALAQTKLEAIYTDIDAIWKLYQEFAGTYSLHNPFNPSTGGPGWSVNSQRLYQNAERRLGLHHLILVMHSKQFVQTLREDYSQQNEKVFQVLLKMLYDNHQSIWMFALARGTHWFDQYRSGARPAWMTSQIDPMVVIDCPTASHPHELYGRHDGQIRRNTFQDKFNRGNDMANIKENIFHPPYWLHPGPQPADWAENLPWPGNPSLCIQGENGKYPVCRGCNNSLGVFTYCLCAPDSERVYKTPLVEIAQRILGAGYKRGVRALSPISKDQLLCECVGELIPLNQQASPPFGDEKYCNSWWPQPKLNTGGRRANVQPKVGPIATLISGKQGNWTKFICHRDKGANVAMKLIPIAGKWRTVVYAIRNIDFGEEITMDYRKAARGERTLKKRGVVHRFQMALSMVAEEDD